MLTMTYASRALCLLVLLTLSIPTAFSQKGELTLEDAVIKRFSNYWPESISGFKWVEGESAYSYQKKAGDDVQLIKVDCASGKETVVTTKTKMQEAAKRVEGQFNSFGSIRWVNPTQFIFQDQRAVYIVNPKAGKCDILIPMEPGTSNHDFEPERQSMAFTAGKELFVGKSEGQVVDGVPREGENDILGQAVHRFEFGISKGTFWAPDGSRLLFYAKDETMVTDYPLVNMGSNPAELNSIKYPMAGQPSHRVKLGIYHPDDKYVRYANVTGDAEQYLTNISWSPDAKSFYIAILNREQNSMTLNQYHHRSGELEATLFTEKSDKYVEPLHPMYFRKTGDFIWMSERDGYMQLFHYQKDGTLIRKLTTEAWDAISFLGYDESESHALFTGTGPNPLEQHAYKVNLESGAVEKLTKENGVHNVSLSPDRKYLLDNFSNATTPRIMRMMSLDGKVSRELLKAEDPTKDITLGQTELFDIKAKDGTPLHCRMIKPANFDAKTKYPVLIYVYGGPHVQLIRDSWMAGAPLWMHWLANQGYVVFTLDNRGSDHRGLAFEQATFRQLGQVEMQDQVAGVNYLKKQKFVDDNRIALHGWSFGGFMTTSLMLNHPDLFTAGVAGGPVIDWELYEIMYTERYMDTPKENPDGYAKTKLQDKVSNLKGDLMLIHGTVDDVVVWQHSLEFVQACVEAGVQLDYFVYPGHPHNVRGKDRAHLMRKVLDYIMDKNQ